MFIYIFLNISNYFRTLKLKSNFIFFKTNNLFSEKEHIYIFSKKNIFY